MNLELRLRRLEEQVRPEPAESPFVDWATTLPIEDVRALRDYLRALEGTTTGEVGDDPRHERARALLAAAPAEARSAVGLSTVEISTQTGFDNPDNLASTSLAVLACRPQSPRIGSASPPRDYFTS